MTIAVKEPANDRSDDLGCLRDGCTPGPATLLTVARATSSGTKVGIATGVGIAAGDMIHTFMAIVGISAIIATSALLVQHHQIHWRSVSRLPRHSCHS
jgi:hypothetical protein